MDHESTEYNYSVSPLRYSTASLSVKLTYIEQHSNNISLTLFNKQTSSPLLSLPDRIVRHSRFIPLTTKPINRPTTRSQAKKANISLAPFSQILHRFEFNDYSTILREVEEAIISSSSSLRLRGNKGVVEVKIWKIVTNVFRADDAKEKVAIERLIAKESIRVFRCDPEEEEEEENECSICLEDYTEGRSLVAKLPCGHDFHGVCIHDWLHLHIKRHCPMCRSRISCRRVLFG